MHIVGLTGGIGSGKSEAARIFASLGVPVVDVDVISHRLTEKRSPILTVITEKFGADYFKADGTLDRAKLREKIFSDDSARLTLEAILHPAIYAQALLELDKHADAPYQILAVPLLFESERYKALIASSLVIDCDEALQVSRVIQRSKMTESEVRAIMAKQMSREARLALADDVIDNSTNIAHLDKLIRQYNQKMLMYLHS